MRAYQSPRDMERFPREDEALGRAVHRVVEEALEKGVPRPTLFVFFSGQLDRFDLVPLMKQPRATRDRMIAAIAGQREVECVALIGVLQVTRAGRTSIGKGAVAYLEWPDNRWWTAWMPLDAEGKPARDRVEERSAVEGYPRPGGVGGWFSLARRAGLRLHMNTKDSTVH